MPEVAQMQWRGCVGFPDYEVSECGDVRRVAPSMTRRVGHRLRGFIDGDGYLRYNLINAAGDKRIVIAHRLVAEAFIGPQPSPVHEVAHNNGSRVSAHFRDLRWATRKENDDDRAVHGTQLCGENNPRATITEQDVKRIRAEYRLIKLNRGDVAELDRRYGLCRASIVRIATGKAWKHVPMERAQ